VEWRRRAGHDELVDVELKGWIASAAHHGPDRPHGGDGTHWSGLTMAAMTTAALCLEVRETARCRQLRQREQALMGREEAPGRGGSGGVVNWRKKRRLWRIAPES
jgi:hypothetical protein